MSKVYIDEFEAKQIVDTTFLVKHIALMESRDGKNYLNVILADSSGTIESRKWHGAKEVISIIKNGDIVNATGRINLFQNRLQFIIQEISLVNNLDLDMSLYIRTSKTSSEKMFEELLSFSEEIKVLKIKELVTNILYDTEISRRLKSWPAGKAIHHAYHGGLLEHTLSCVKLGKFLAEMYGLNTDLVVSGLVLHDLGKIYELSDGPMFEYTEEGKLVGHVVKSVEIFEKYVSRISDFPRAIRMHLKHIILSHHGEYEYGSPKLPATKEAFIVHYVDQIDSKISAIEEIKKSDNTQGNWSGYVKHLDRMIFKADLNELCDTNALNTTISQSVGDVSNSNTDLKYSMAEKLKDIKLK